MEKRILFCILVHDSPQQTLRLMRTIYNTHDYFNIHVDKKADEGYRDLLDALSRACPNVTVVSNELCGWGGFSLVRSSNALLKLGLEAHADWTHAFLLSATHLPLIPVATIRAALTAGKSYFKWHEIRDAVPAPQDQWLKSILDRIEWSFDETDEGKMVKGDWLGRPDFSYFVGSQWVALARDHVGYVLDAADGAIAQRLAHSNVADEAYYQTLLKNSVWSDDCWGKESTQVFWSAGAWSPKILTLEDYRKLAATPRAWFTRKFNDDLGDEAEVVAAIDEIAGPVEWPDLPERVLQLAEQGG
ncbi:MAG: beta-1,6-N-acetylglucosaminyltransferase [Alphaproteobacteria bacterium]|nr:beta-1,6-N-acetylglucosaminyltransferase [Alphaproteobacteria bacterium]